MSVPKRKEKKTAEPPVTAGGCGNVISDAEGNSISTFGCDMCERSFSTKSGLGLHKRRKHAEVFHQAALRPKIKARWNEEEDRILALAEIALPGQANAINARLRTSLPHRSIQAIACRRKQQKYRLLLENLRRATSAPPTRTAVGSPVTCQGESCPYRKREEAVKSGNSDWTVAIFDYLDSLEPGDDKFGLPVLCSLIRKRTAGTELMVELETQATGFIDSLSHKRPPQRCNDPTSRKSERKSKAYGKLGKRHRRRQQYAAIQRMYDRNRSRCSEYILSGKWRVTMTERGLTPSKSELLKFWSDMMRQDKGEDLRPVCQIRDIDWSLLAPITVEEVINILKSSNESAPGPDGVTLKSVKSVPVGTLTRMFNLWLISERLPDCLSSARTILIPKSDSPTHPSEYRPITIGSVIVRIFHKIMARRLSGSFNLNPIQRAFMPIDGCAVNVTMLDALLSQAKKELNPLNILFLDLRKAFDSVKHDTVIRAASRMGCPGPLLRYLKHCYDNSSTILFDEEVAVSRGVRQGDPMSPVLFNAVLDEAFGCLLKVGPTLEGCTVQGAGFADDVALVARSVDGLQTQIDLFLGCLKESGLEPNPLKCRSMCITIDGKAKRWLVNRMESFTVGGKAVPAMGADDLYRYLGIDFGYGGRASAVGSILHKGLEELTHAPLKPQQRMYILRNHLFPRLAYNGVLGTTNPTRLRRLDEHLRSRVRSWLKVPNDTPSAYLHADVKAGGLGIPSLKTQVTLMKRKRLIRMADSNDPMVKALGESQFVAKLLERAGKPKVDSTPVETAEEAKALWAERLHRTVDGAGLAEADHVPFVHDWLIDGTRLMSGREYINLVKIRGSLMYTRSRRCRGHPNADPYCPMPNCHRKRCWESIGHISQQCPDMWGLRVKRHDSVLMMLDKCLCEKGFQTVMEPVIPTSITNRKPDLIVWNENGEAATVIDVQITSDSAVAKIEQCHGRKVTKYDTEEIRDWVRRRTGKSIVKVSSATLNWRGCWSAESVELLLSLGVSKRDLKLMTIRSMSFTARMISTRMRTTGSMRRTKI